MCDGGPDQSLTTSRKGSTPTVSVTLVAGEPAPPFTLPDADGTAVSLASYRGRRVVVYFYPAASTPGCTKQACDFRDSVAVLGAAGYEVIGISPDKAAKQAKFRDTEHVPFPLLCDPERDVLVAYGAYGQKMLYGKQVTGVIRSTFVIGPDGLVEHAWYGVRATGHVAKLLRDLQI